MIPGGEFNTLWKALNQPIKVLEASVNNVQRQARRAEVAGAAEVVSALPAVGEKGRILFLTTDNTLYYDNGTEWVALTGGGLAIATQSVQLAAATSTTSLTFINVTGSDVSHTFTKDHALIAVTVLAVGAAATTAEIVPQVDGVDGTTVGGVRFAVGYTTLIASVFGGLLAAAAPATVRLRLRSSSGTAVSVQAAIKLTYVILEFD